MKGLAGLLRLRKRSDRVKLAILLFLFGSFLAGDVLMEAAGFLSMSGKPVEYVLNSGVDGAKLDGRIKAVLQRDNVIAVSRQREYTLTCSDSSIVVTEVSPEYLSACFGLSAVSAGTDFFLGIEAFKTLCGNSSQSPVRMTCQSGEKSVSGVFILDKSLPDKLAVTRGTSLTLGNAQTLRVMLNGKDVSGLETDWFEENGFIIENREMVTENLHEAELLMIRLKYGGAACILAFLLGWQLFAYGRRLLE